jgi:hypothetical protein
MTQSKELLLLLKILKMPMPVVLDIKLKKWWCRKSEITSWIYKKNKVLTFKHNSTEEIVLPRPRSRFPR